MEIKSLSDIWTWLKGYHEDMIVFVFLGSVLTTVAELVKLWLGL